MKSKKEKKMKLFIFCLLLLVLGLAVFGGVDIKKPPSFEGFGGDINLDEHPEYLPFGSSLAPRLYFPEESRGEIRFPLAEIRPAPEMSV